MANARTCVPPNPTVFNGPAGMAASFGYVGTHKQFWAGYTDNSSNNGGVIYNQVQGGWVQPSVRGNSAYPQSKYLSDAPNVGFWVGLGGVNGGALVQAGAASIGTATPQYRFFTQDLPYNPGAVWEGPAIRPGQTTFVDVVYNFDGSASYYLENVTTGAYSPFTNQASPDFTGHSADFVSEKPSTAAYQPRFSGVTFHGAAAFWNHNNGEELVANLNYTKQVEVNGNGTVMASPTNPSSPSSFTVNWYHD